MCGGGLGVGLAVQEILEADPKRRRGTNHADADKADDDLAPDALATFAGSADPCKVTLGGYRLVRVHAERDEGTFHRKLCGLIGNILEQRDVARL